MESDSLSTYAAFCSFTFEKLGRFPDAVWPPQFRYLSTDKETITEADLVEFSAALLYAPLLERCRYYFPRTVHPGWRWHVARTVVRSAAWHARSVKQFGEIDLLFCLILAYEGGVRYGLDGVLDPLELSLYQEISTTRRATVRAILGAKEAEAEGDERQKLLWNERATIRDVHTEGAENRDFSLRHQARAAADMAHKLRGRLPYGIVATAFAAGLRELPKEEIIPFIERVALPKTKEQCESAGDALRNLLVDEARQEQHIKVLSEVFPQYSGQEVVALAERAMRAQYASCPAEFLLALVTVSGEIEGIERGVTPLAASGGAFSPKSFTDWVARSVTLLAEPDRDPLSWVRSRVLYQVISRQPQYGYGLARLEGNRRIFPNVDDYDVYAAALNRKPPHLQRAKQAYLRLIEAHEALGNQLYAREARDAR